MRRTIVTVVLLTGLAGCGSSASTSEHRTARACLSAADVDRRTSQIAMGYETSDAEVAAKHAKIRAIRAKQCR